MWWNKRIIIIDWFKAIHEIFIKRIGLHALWFALVIVHTIKPWFLTSLNVPVAITDIAIIVSSFWHECTHVPDITNRLRYMYLLNLITVRVLVFNIIIILHFILRWITTIACLIASIVSSSIVWIDPKHSKPTDMLVKTNIHANFIIFFLSKSYKNNPSPFLDSLLIRLPEENLRGA